MSYGGPKTSIGSSFQSQNYNQGYNQKQMYSAPEQILAPPQIHVDDHGQEQMDPDFFNQLVATNMYLAQQQRLLQQQLENVQTAAQQFHGMNRLQQRNFSTPPITPGGGGMYQQNKHAQTQNLQNVQPIVTAVPGQAGYYSVYNPLTGQQSYFVDQNVAQNLQQQQQQLFLDQQAEMFMEANSPPQQPGTPRFQVSPPASEISTNNGRSITPPKKSNSPPVDHNPLPPPSANAFRFNRGGDNGRHKKASSLANVITSALPAGTETIRSAVPKTAGVPQTPMTGTFGPGQSRVGEHPIRQPRNPPNLEELKAKPTSKYEGSKNFATRQRRSAVHNLVRAGLERRRAPGSNGSTGSISPISETGEFQFVQTSSGENSDTDSGRSGRLSGKNSLRSLRTSIHGAIGSERPSSRQTNRQEVDTRPTTASTSASASDCEKEKKMAPIISSFAAAMKLGGRQGEVENKQRRAPMMVLSSVEKRKSTMF